jgi:heme/copper-type cytochrome/quinol oxidase subunit 1
MILTIGLVNLNDTDSTLDVNVQDTYFVIEHFLIAEILFIGYLLLGLSYWFVEKIIKKHLVKILTKIHTLILVGSFIFYWIIFFILQSFGF